MHQLQTLSSNLDRRFQLHHVRVYHFLVRALVTCVTLTICTRLAVEATFHEHVHIRVHVPEITNQVHHREEAVVQEIPIIRYRQRHRPRPRPRHRHRHRHRHRYKHESIVPATAMAAAHLYHDDIDNDNEVAVDDDLVVVDDDHYAAGSANTHTAYARYNELDNDYEGGAGVANHLANVPVHVDAQDADSPHRNSYFIDDNDDDSRFSHDRVIRKPRPRPRPRPRPAHHASTPLTATSIGASASAGASANENYRYAEVWPTVAGVTLSLLDTPVQAEDRNNRSVYYETDKNYASALAFTRPSIWSHSPQTSHVLVGEDVDNSLSHTNLVRYYHTAPAAVTTYDDDDDDDHDHHHDQFVSRQLHNANERLNAAAYLRPDGNTVKANANAYYADV